MEGFNFFGSKNKKEKQVPILSEPDVMQVANDTDAVVAANVANESIQSPEAQLETLEAALLESFNYRPQLDGSRLVEDSAKTSESKTAYQDYLCAHPEMLEKVLARTPDAGDLFQIQLQRLAIEAQGIVAQQGKAHHEMLAA